MRILGFSGKSGHGKDFCSKLAQKIALEEFGVHFGQFALAWPLKARVYAELGGRYSYEDVFHRKPEEVRRLLQIVGTERGRDVFGIEFWTRQVEAFLRVFSESMPFIAGVTISDVRFPNEVEFVRFGARPAEDVYREVRYQVAREFQYTPDHEAYLLEHDLESLQRLDNAYYTALNARLAKEMSKAPGLCLYIQSDRPTLTGEAAGHPSETALDGIDKETGFDGIIVNNTDTTVEDLKEQLRPYVERLLSM